jgi:hypothetical protein
MKKTIIFIIISFIFILVGVLIGLQINNMTECAIPDDKTDYKKQTLEQIEEKFEKYIIMPEMPNRLYGVVKEIKKETIVLTVAPSTIPEIIWEEPIDYNIIINANTSLISYGEINHEQPTEEITKGTFSIQDLKIGDELVIRFEKEINNIDVTATEVIK